MLFPNNMVLMNLADFFKKKDKILAENLPCLLSNSIFNLLAETKAISIPEKRAEKNIASKRKIQKDAIELI